MSAPSLEARRYALRREIALTRAGVAVRFRRVREVGAMASFAASAARLLPPRWRWLGMALAIAAIVGVVRERSRD